MSVCSWIVCERGGRWTPALRLALERLAATRSFQQRYRLHEVRRLDELAAELVDRPSSIAAIEIHRGNYSDSLEWLVSASRRFPDVRCIALCDRSIDDAYFTAALREAGALEIAHSPRRLDAILEFARRHATNLAKSTAPSDQNGPLTLTARAWASLPWQDA